MRTAAALAPAAGPLLLVPLLLAACAHRTGAGASSPGREGTSAAARAPSPPPAPVPEPPLAVLSPAPGDGEVLLFVAVVRAHPVGPRLEPFLAAWPGWSEALHAIAPHPLRDLDWVDVVGPTSAAGERMLARTVAPDDVIDGRIGALAAGSTESAQPLVDGDSSHAAAARLDGSLRVVVRAEPHLTLVSPSDASRALTHALSGVHVEDPAGEADEALRADIPQPHAAVPLVPDEVRRLRAHVYSRPGGGAEAVAELACDDDAAAARVASSLRGLVARLDNVVVRLLTHDLLGGVVIEVHGAGQRNGGDSGAPRVTARVPATRDQLESVVTLATGLLPSAPASP